MRRLAGFEQSHLALDRRLGLRHTIILLTGSLFVATAVSGDLGVAAGLFQGPWSGWSLWN
jgi:hypothetical protein